ncbi:EFR1 family ferrodoxin [Clostridium paridis]|uniref:EFR1 family ferrodoxin n=1 Tax=Clostridium paridis TaxID=2803863 RepID=A0A937K4F7_9CLOT|nr:EFR1 family ferrodoxin [Clostridium paridis]MBL4931829.1 EFR1 family ferrodoxin [Clostridium paridis]
MIFYFSGTGNSAAIAKKIASNIENEKVIFIPDLLNSNADLSIYNNEERIGFVFPCYTANPPKMVLEFCERLSNQIDFSDKYVYAVINYANHVEAAYLTFKKKLPKLDSWFQITMPGNIILRNFNIRDKEYNKKLLADSEIIISKFVHDIKEKRAIIMYKNSDIKARLSTKFGLVLHEIIFTSQHKKFYADDNCVNCGKCEKVCPTNNITLKDKPVWGNNCTACLACINRCPKKAIQNGKETITKDRYVHPDYK